MAKQLIRKCQNSSGYTLHHHIRLEGGRTKQAQVYPRELCEAICKGLQEQIKADEVGQFLLMESTNEATTSRELLHIAKELTKRYRRVEEFDDATLEVAWDDVSGAELDLKQVRKARAEEVEYIHKTHVYDKEMLEECYQTICKLFITVRWIDINKGDNQSPSYRSRLVAREINTYKRDDLIAATPPLEPLKLIVSMAAIGNNGAVIMVNDISRAFFHAKVARDVYVQLPPEDTAQGEEGMCGKLRFPCTGRGAQHKIGTKNIPNSIWMPGFNGIQRLHAYFATTNEESEHLCMETIM